MRHITVAYLQALVVCPGQMDLFGATFGTRVSVTLANVHRAMDAGLNVAWLVCRVADAPTRATYDAAVAAAQAAYDAAMVPAQAAYAAAKVPAQAAYAEAMASAWAAYDAVMASARATYNAAMASAQAAYDAAMVRAIYHALRGHAEATP